jgi:hypothetical protein
MMMARISSCNELWQQLSDKKMKKNQKTESQQLLDFERLFILQFRAKSIALLIDRR